MKENEMKEDKRTLCKFFNFNIASLKVNAISSTPKKFVAKLNVKTKRGVSKDTPKTAGIESSAREWLNAFSNMIPKILPKTPVLLPLWILKELK